MGRWGGPYGWLRLRVDWFGWNQAMGIARITMRVDGERVRLDAKAYPWPTALLIVLPSWWFGMFQEDSVLALLFFVLFCGLAISLSWGVSLLSLRREVQSAVRRIAAEIEAS